MKSCFLPWWKDNYQRFQAILMDIDGTLVAGERALPGAADTLDWLRRRRFPFCLLTNDGNRSPQEKSRLLGQAGLSVQPEEIVSCGMALDELARHPELGQKLFFVMGDLGRPNYADTAGLRITNDPGQLEQCAGIIVGEGYYDWQRYLNLALNTLLSAPDKMMIVPNPDSYWPNGVNGEVGIGAGGKARFLAGILAEAGVRVEPIYLGKPYRAIFRLALEHIGRCWGIPDLSADQVLMLGDSLKSDIAGARLAGLRSGLLLSGVTSRVLAEAAPDEERPDWVFKALA